MRLLHREPPRTGIVKYFSASHWKSGKKGSLLALNRFQAGKKSEMVLELVWMSWWSWKYGDGNLTAGLKVRDLGPLWNLHMEPLKSYSCLKPDFQCCTYIHLNCCCFWLALKLMRSKFAIDQPFLLVRKNKNQHKTFLPSPPSGTRFFSLLQFPCLEDKEVSLRPYPAPSSRRDLGLPPPSLGLQTHI